MTDDAPRAQQVRLLASLVRTKPAVMELIQADAKRRDPQHRKPLVVLLDGALDLRAYRAAVGVLAAHPSALLKKLLRMLTVVNRFHTEFELLVLLFHWIHHIAHLLEADTSYEDPQSQLLTFVHHLQQSCPHEELLSLVAYLEKITVAFTPHLFEYLKQPLLPRTNNDLELFIGRIKKSSRHITGRKNTQEFILREGSSVAVLFGLPHTDTWGDAFSRVHPNDFHHTLHLLPKPEKRRKCWRPRRDLVAYLASVEQPWGL